MGIRTNVISFCSSKRVLMIVNDNRFYKLDFTTKQNVTTYHDITTKCNKILLQTGLCEAFLPPLLEH